jgi:hypothetical protein
VGNERGGGGISGLERMAVIEVVDQQFSAWDIDNEEAIKAGAQIIIYLHVYLHACFYIGTCQICTKTYTV